MPFKEHNRQYDLVVFGATGYTGRLAAEYITANFPVNLKWAIAGRSESKLQGLVEDCKKLHSDRNPPAIETAQVDSYDEISALAKKTFVLITTVGPYSAHGEYAVKACAEAGTHYFDVTGETPWVYKMIKKYEKTAKESGAILIPQMALEAAPADLLTWSLAQTLRKQMDARTKDVVISIHNMRSTPSGGTLSTFTTVFDHFTLKIPSRKDEFYGPKFHWNECYRPRNWLHGVIIHWVLVLGVLLVAIGPPIRALFRKLVPAPGTGPSRDEMDKEEAEWRGIANPDTESPTDKQAFVRAWYNGSMYQMTAMFCCEGARTVLEDDLQLDGGFYTPCCLGQGIIDRARVGGFRMETRIQQK
ncbi:hypothetical protein TrVFT333_008404 [Trichoderma virens FT-333]|nr:hypothetical protein TrVFT333_008404 [Trichoderma virens FT-333]